MPQKKKIMMPAGEFGELIHKYVMKYGGYVNFHAHLDRASTLDEAYLEDYGTMPIDAASAPLRVKQSLTGELHLGKAYQDGGDLQRRISEHIDEMAREGVQRVVSFIDATADIGLIAIETALALKEAYREKIDFQIATHPIFGFSRDEERWKVFYKACKQADIVGALPERDCKERNSGNIGSDEHFRRVLEIGKDLGKEVHIHVGQENDPTQTQIFDLMEAVRWIGSPNIADKEVTVWAVHAISSSAYDEKTFRKVLDGLREYNIGVVCCPRAALSMRQLRPRTAPTHNSIARILEMGLWGVPVRLGTDNIADMYVPTGSGMLYEVLVLADAIRFYNPRILAKFAAGMALNESDKEVIRRHLKEDYNAFRKINPDFEFCIPLD